MKMELKVFLLSIIMSLMFIGVFTYFVNATQKDFYVLQVGIYSKEENKNQKVNELKELGANADYYSKNNQYYVISFLSDNKEEVEKYQEEYKIKGIVKTYPGYIQEDSQRFLERLKGGEV